MCAVGRKARTRVIENFRQAVSGWEMIDRGYDQARALGYLGHALTFEGDLTGARTAFSQALGMIDFALESARSRPAGLIPRFCDWSRKFSRHLRLCLILFCAKTPGTTAAA